MRKKRISFFLCAAIFVVILTGCGGQTENVQEKEAKEIKIWYYWETEGHQEGLNKIIDDYNASQTKYKVKSEYVPFADFKKQLSIRASIDDLPDLVIVDSPDHAFYAKKGIFADLTDKFDVSGYYEASVASCTLDDILYGVPFGCNCLGLYYNEDMLKEAGVPVPHTWEELKSAALALTEGDVTGFAMSCVQNEEGTFGFMPFLWSAGASYDTMGSEGAVEALSLFQELVASGSMPKECINWTQADVMSQFESGNIAMMINGPWQIPTMEKDVADINWKVTMIPAKQNMVSAVGGENYAVIAGGDEKGALAFLEYATKEESVKYLMKSLGYIAAQKEIAKIQFTEKDNEAYQVFTEILGYAKARGPHENWPEISDAVSQALNQVIVGTKSPSQAAYEAQIKINSIQEEGK